jgi:hypothetical protein
MSLLYLRSRPIVAFDANNSDHRRWFAEFVKYRGWGKCPVRFMAENLEVDLVTFIEHKMLAYYVQQEFKNENKGKVKQKPRAKSTLRVVRSKQPIPIKAGKKPARVSTSAKASQ